MRTAVWARSTWPSTSTPRRRASTGRKLQETVELATRFLDNVVDANKYVPAVPEIEEAARRARRIGLGIMGLGDLMYHAGIRYGSPEGEEFAAQIMEFIRFHAMRTSIEQARTRGSFPAIEGSIYDPDNLQWRPPTPLSPYTHDFGRPALDWSEIVAGHPDLWHPQCRPDHGGAHRHHRHRLGLRGLRLRAGLCPGLHPPLSRTATRTWS